MKQFMVILVENGKAVKDSMRIIPAETEEEAINRFNQIPFAAEKINLYVHAEVCGTMTYKDGFPTPQITNPGVFDSGCSHKMNQIDTDDVRCKNECKNCKGNEIKEAIKADNSINEKIAPKKEEEPKKKTYIVGVHNSNNPAECYFKSGTCLVIAATSEEDACQIYSIEASNYTECPPVKAIEVIGGHEHIEHDGCFVTNELLVAFAGIMCGDTGEMIHRKAIAFPESPLLLIALSVGKAIIGDMAQSYYREYLIDNELTNLVDKEDNLVGMTMTNYEIWLRK